MAGSRLQLRISPPEKFSGTTDFNDWLSRVLSYLSLESPRYKDITIHYIEVGAVLTEADLDRTYNDANTPDALKGSILSRVLYNLLLQLTEGPPYDLLRTMDDITGFEALRLMKIQFARNQRHNMLHYMKKVVQFSMPATDYINDLLVWERDYGQLEKRSESSYPKS